MMSPDPLKAGVAMRASLNDKEPVEGTWNTVAKGEVLEGDLGRVDVRVAEGAEADADEDEDEEEDEA